MGTHNALARRGSSGAYICGSGEESLEPPTVRRAQKHSLSRVPFSGTRLNRLSGHGSQLGGAWSTYWYNNFVFESEITKGLNVFRVSDPRLAGARVLGHLNPQTQEFTIG